MSALGLLHRRVSPFGIAGRLLRFPLRLLPGGVVVPVLGGINRGFRWVTGAATAGCWLGIYEEEHQAALRRLVPEGSVVYDVGANVGFYTLALARLVGPSGKVYAFEPEARNVSMLRRHVELNGLGQVTIVQVAVSAGAGLVGFSGDREQGRMAQTESYLVPTVSLDEFVARGYPIPAFVKMDVEGAETMVLEGAASILARRQTSWMIATHGAHLQASCRNTMACTGHALTNMSFGAVTEKDADFLAIPSEHGAGADQVPLGSTHANRRP